MPACSCPAISPLTAQGSRKRPLIPLDDALSARRFQAAAELQGFLARTERADHGSVVNSLVAEIRALGHGTARPQHRRLVASQAPIRGLRFGLILLRRDLHQIAAASARGGLHRGVGGHPGGGRWLSALWRER